MAKKKRHIEHEVKRKGPLIFERFGREVNIRSEWEEREHEKYLEHIKSNLPLFKEDINKKIEKIIDIIQRYEPLELLHTTSIANLLVNPEEYEETTHEGKEARVEYAQSIILSFERKDQYETATESVIKEYNNIIDEILMHVFWFLAFSTGFEEISKTEKDLRVENIGRFLFVRGDSIQEHHLEMINEIFYKVDDFLLKNIGFDTKTIIEALFIIEKQIQNNISINVECVKLAKELHEEFILFSSKGKSNLSLKDLMSEFNSLPGIEPKIEKLKEEFKKIPRFIHEIKEEKKLSKSILDVLSSEFGENREFISFKKAPGWPTNNSIIYRKPLIKVNNKYYCFNPTLLFRNIGTILEQIIMELDEKYFKESYQKKRADYLELKSLEYFKNTLPGALIYHKLYYYDEMDGKVELFETDGLVLFDNNIFIIEAKAGSLSISARRGSIDRLKSNIKDLIDSAYKQALRTKNYIEKTKMPEFIDENGIIKLKIEKKDIYDNIFIVNTTFELLAGLSTHLSSVKDLGMIKGREWPWSVYINNLRIISELIESPSIFIHYLKRRIKTNEYSQFKSSDEIDYFLFYLQDGLYFDDNRLKDTDMVSLSGYTTSLDRYYDYLGGRVQTGEKPSLKIPKVFKEIIYEIENTKKLGFSTITTFLLDLSIEGMREVLHGYNQARKRYAEDKTGHQFTMTINDNESMLVIGLCDINDIEYIDRTRKYCDLKMYQTKRSKCAFLVKKIIADENYDWDFEFIEKEWIYDNYLEKQLTVFKEKKREKFGNKIKNIGRNEKCPCGSGLKYKYCCGK